jgi:hypothetical protein
MIQPTVTRDTLLDVIARLDAAFARPGRVYLIGESSHLYEGWREWTTQIEIAADVSPKDHAPFSRIVDTVKADLGIAVFDESPADVIPLPAGFASRARPAGNPAARLSLWHFDPYSVCFRFIARGDEPDYHGVLTYLEHGWVTLDDMEKHLEALLPRFTAETIQQDPAEFRRKYKGLLQMSRRVRARTTHRPTVV